ncbi:hypothetical protein [Mucilaginibacter aquariorum]|uniref:RES domain-containing protein n=1 Tax=Mucilaginibacter aquariorum TaxID=2967225 RepID=A0ABT1T576_9SPHI|nr:hypothetical protein [Mucilaginibacter aquariorum]MCQ6959719.1 hypothetical protein [Mucilaginibacter aquariorum]
MTANDIQIYKECLACLSIQEIKSRIEHYKRAVDLRTITPARLKQELRRVFTINPRGREVEFFIKADTLMKEFYLDYYHRIRKFTENDIDGMLSKQFQSMQKEQDVWCRSAEDINSIGRLNDSNEPVLYAGSGIENAIFETECKVGEFFFLIVYQTKKRLRVAQIHANIEYPEFDELENAKLTILQTFLQHEFVKVVQPGQEYLYKSSIAIYKHFFKSDLNDAFTYPSVKTARTIGYNICFEENKAKAALQFLGVRVCRLVSIGQNPEFVVEIFYDGFLKETGGFDFFPQNSEKSNANLGAYKRGLPFH